MVESAILQILQTDFSLQHFTCFNLQICKPLITHTFGDSNSSHWPAARPTHFVIHARKAILGGLSPAANRTVPPPRPDYFYRLTEVFPYLTYSTVPRKSSNTACIYTATIYAKFFAVQWGSE
jgi:hypothetical protein